LGDENGTQTYPVFHGDGGRVCLDEPRDDVAVVMEHRLVEEADSRAVFGQRQGNALLAGD